MAYEWAPNAESPSQIVHCCCQN